MSKLRFYNILLNAIRHNENFIKEIFIKISRIENEDKKFIKIEFIDNGIGISDCFKHTIFQKKIENGSNSKGLRIGLTLVKKIIDSYNGKIYIEDKISGDHTQGSNFIVTIPEAVKNISIKILLICKN